MLKVIKHIMLLKMMEIIFKNLYKIIKIIIIIQGKTIIIKKDVMVAHATLYNIDMNYFFGNIMVFS